MQREVYVDLLFAYEAVADLLTLWAVGVWLRLPLRPWRLVIAGGLGGAAAVAVSLWQPIAQLAGGPLGYVGIPLLLVSLTYWPSLGPRWASRLASLLIAYLAVGLVSGGGALFFQSRGQGGLVMGGGAPLLTWLPAPSSGPLALGLLVGLIAGGYLVAAHRQRRQLEAFQLELTIELVAGQPFSCPGLVDTGNQLRSPFSQLPVVLLDPALRGPMEHPLPAERLVPIPYRSVGQPNGVVMGLIPERLEVSRGGQRLPVGRGLVAFAPEPLETAGDYLALVPPALLDAWGG